MQCNGNRFLTRTSDYEMPPCLDTTSDLRDPTGQVVPDDLGTELADLDAAIREAAETARSFVKDRRLGGYNYEGWYFQIRSDEGVVYAPAFAADNEEACDDFIYQSGTGSN